MKKNVLLDMSILRHPYCGLGQIALNYCHYFRDNDISTLPFDITLLVPQNFVGQAGEQVKYVVDNPLHRLLPWLLPHVDLWHQMHQLSKFPPPRCVGKVLLTLHDFNPVYEKKGSKAERYLRHIRADLMRADHIICISNFTLGELRRLGGEAANKPADVVYNGVEIIKGANGPLRPAQVREQRPFYLAVGEVKEKKNIRTIVDMMRFCPDNDLYIAGNDNTRYADEIRAMITQKGLDNVRLLGFVSDGEREWLYENCQALLMPSLCEGFGLPVIEAMSYGKPVITSGATSLAEIGGQHAAVWANFEPEQMLSTVRDAVAGFTNERRKQAITYAQSFSYERNIAAYMERYAQMLGEP